MKIVIDLHEQTLSSVVSDGVFYAQAETTIDFTTQGGKEGVLNGASCALLAPDGVTLAHTIASGNKAVLNTNTEECVKFIEGSSIDSEKIAFLAIGDSEKPLAILPVAVKRNPLASIAPPTALAPSYPTSEALKAILTEMTAQAQRAEDAVEATEKAQKSVAKYVDETFPTKVEQAEGTLANATTKGVQAVTDKATQSVNSITAHTTTIVTALDQKQTQIEASIETKAQSVNSALDTKITSATTAIDGKVQEANEAKDDAVKAKGEAEGFKGQAEGFAKTASESAESASKSAQQAEDAKDAIGDVGGRLDAVETSVAEKVPYLSPFMQEQYDFKRGNFKMLNIAILTQLHEGFLMRDSYSTSKDRLLIPAKNEVIQVDSVGTVRLSVIEADKTTIYSYSGSTLYKTTVSGSGVDLTFIRETITAMPTAVEELSGVVGYKTTNGFIVCTGGHILSADLKTEVATFYAVSSYNQIRKSGEKFYYYDGAVRQLATLTVADDGTPSIAYNSYKQSDGVFYPITGTMAIKTTSRGALIGATAHNIGYLYGEFTDKKIAINVLPFKGSNIGLIICPNSITAVFNGVTNDRGEIIAECATGMFYTRTFNMEIGKMGAYRDQKGNMMVFQYMIHNDYDSNQYYNLFVAK